MIAAAALWILAVVTGAFVLWSWVDSKKEHGRSTEVGIKDTCVTIGAMSRPAVATIVSRARAADGTRETREEEKWVEPQVYNDILARLLPKRFAVLDLETTGLNAQDSEIIEYGAIIVAIGESQHKGFQILAKPSRKLPDEIVKITGITDRLLAAEGRDSREAFIRFTEFIGDLPVVTYNAAFDMSFLWTTAERFGLTFDNRYTCALHRCRRAFPELRSHRLTYVSETFRLDTSNAHRAIDYCIRAMMVFLLSTLRLNRRVRFWRPTP